MSLFFYSRLVKRFGQKEQDIFKFERVVLQRVVNMDWRLWLRLFPSVWLRAGDGFLISPLLSLSLSSPVTDLFHQQPNIQSMTRSSW